ncbi:TolB-like protein [Algoriphagus iocasae]|uniref:TolB-like protein n=1 Tax=Algoriphagus iocasae TaxID=1836499 RepID=A0A841MRH7_9BACT|nr:hypothetical protein [Algoriphagus iocasae]MBB6328249.1 TolB-like protein [Algoriphagus iocasae]
MKSITLIFAMLFLLASNAYSQAKQDVLTLNSGERKEGKVTGITDTSVKFRYPGEEFDYEIKKTDLSQIEFASGRIEKFSAGDSMTGGMPTSNPGSSPDRHNKLAVLPFAFISNDPGMQSGSMGTLTQSTTANFVKGEYGTLTLQDPMTTNAILAKNNIKPDNLAAYTPDELAKLLGVEFIIYGTVNITNKGTSTYGSAGTTFNEKQTSTYDSNKSSEKTKGGAYTSSVSSTTIEYDTTVDLRMFNDRGDNLYSQSRHVFGTASDAYKGGVEYMIKRTPFGSKYGKK